MGYAKPVSGGETRGKNCLKSCPILRVPAQKLFKPKSETQNSIQLLLFSRNFPFQKLSFKYRHNSICRLRKSDCASPFFARAADFGRGGKFDFANRLNGVGKFAFCGGSDRLQYCGICAFRGVPYLPARGKFPGCRAVAVSHSELRISFCSAVKNISKAKSGH